MKIPTDKEFQDIIYAWRDWVNCHYSQAQELKITSLDDDVLTEVKSMYIDNVLNSNKI